MRSTPARRSRSAPLRSQIDYPGPMHWIRTAIVLLAVALAPTPAQGFERQRDRASTQGLEGQHDRASAEGRDPRQDRADAQEDSVEGNEKHGTNDGRRTLDRLAINVMRGTVGVFSNQNLMPLLIGAGAASFSTLLDDELARPGGRQSGFGEIFDVFGNPLVVGLGSIGALGVGRLVHGQHFRDSSYDLLVATTVNFFYTGALKAATNRLRPDRSNHASFPSGHTSAMFAWATVLERHYGNAVGVPAYFVASLVGASRIDRGSHFLSDVLAGATIGFIVGRTVVRENDAAFDAPRFSLQPVVGPGGQRGLIAVVQF